MKKIIILVLFIFFACINECYAARFSFMVLPADLFLNTKRDYLVYPQSATLISTDIINYYNQHPDMSAIQIGHIRSYLERPENYRFKKEVQDFLTNYQNNYVINFATVQKLASIFKVKQVLLIGCNMDAQNYITRRTMWDFLDVPGATVLDAAYRLSTKATLIDPNNQVVLWQHNYQKLISSRENRMIPTTFNDSSEQLEKIKKYSTKFLTPQVVQETQLALLNISPYQNLNTLHPEVVKPQYVSIDKVKIDSKRGMVRSANAIKKQSAAAGASVAAGAVKISRKGATKAKKAVNKLKKANVKSSAPSVKTELSTDEQLEQIRVKEQEKFELKKAKQRLKYEKQYQKQQLNAAKQKAKKEAKMQLKQEKYELQRKLQPQRTQEVVEETSVQTKQVTPVNSTNSVSQPQESKIIETKSKKMLEKIKDAKQADDDVKIQEVPVTSTPVILPKDNKPSPFFRTRNYKKEMDYTINDF